MKLHLYYLDKNWKKTGVAKNYNLVIDLEEKTFYRFTNSFYGYVGNEHIEVKKKKDIEDYILVLEKNGYIETK